MSTAVINGGRPALEEADDARRIVQALAPLADRADALARAADGLALLAQHLPDALAMVTDSADELFARSAEAGLDIDRGLARGAQAAIRFGSIMGPTEVDSLEALLHSGVLDPQAIRVIGRLGSALATSANTEPARVGALGLLRAARDPDVQRALGFVLHVARELGKALDEERRES